jgi:hypothetical protein
VTGALVRGHARRDAAAPPQPSRHARFLPRLALLALEAGHEAVARAGAIGGERTGVYAAVGGLRVEWSDLALILGEQQGDGAGAWARGLDRMHPFWMLRCLSNNAQALLAADLGARGEGTTFGGATAGAQAIAAAARALGADAIDTAVVIAYDQDDAAALVLAGGGDALARVTAWSGADGEAGEPRPATVARVAARAGDAVAIETSACSAATALLQTIAGLERLGRGAASVVGVSTGPPGLAAAVRVEAVR